MSDFRKLIRWSVGLLALTVTMHLIDRAAGKDWASLAVGVALTVAVLVLYRWGDRACVELDRLEEYEAVHVLPSYRPLDVPDVKPWREGEAS